MVFFPSICKSKQLKILCKKHSNIKPSYLTNTSEDGIVFAISVWQCLLEFCTNIFIAVFYFIYQGESYFMSLLLIVVTYCLTYTIFPSFYLLSDTRFRNVIIRKGEVKKAIWLALKQKYD